jgi:hypothetical protein
MSQPPQRPPGWQPPPGYHQRPMPSPGRPPRKRQTLRKVLLSVFGVLVVIIALSVAFGRGPQAKTPAAASTPTAHASTAPIVAVTLTAAQRRFVGDMKRYVRPGTTGSAALVAIGSHVCSDRRAGDSQEAVVRYVRSQMRGAPAAVARLAEKDLCRQYLPAPRSPKLTTPHATPTAPRAIPESLCGAPPNPYHLNLCGRGSLVYTPPSDVCNYFSCIANFPNGTGYMVECNDGMYSMSGGHQGACSYHQGEGTAVTRA